MLCHVRQAPNPVGGVEVSIAKPPVPVGYVAAPSSFGHVVIKMQVDVLTRQLISNSVPHFKTLGALIEARVVADDLLHDLGAVLRTERLLQGRFESHVASLVDYVVHHLGRERETHRVEAGLGDLGDDAGDVLKLQAFRQHGLLMAGPVGADEGDCVVLGVEDVPADHGERERLDTTRRERLMGRCERQRERA